MPSWDRAVEELDGWIPRTEGDESVGLSGADLQRVLLPGRLGMWGVISGVQVAGRVPGLGLGRAGLVSSWCLTEGEGARPDRLLPAGEGHGQQADGDDGPGEGLYPRAADQLYGTHRNAHLQVRELGGLLGGWGRLWQTWVLGWPAQLQLTHPAASGPGRLPLACKRGLRFMLSLSVQSCASQSGASSTCCIVRISLATRSLASDPIPAPLHPQAAAGPVSEGGGAVRTRGL